MAAYTKMFNPFKVSWFSLLFIYNRVCFILQIFLFPKEVREIDKHKSSMSTEKWSNDMNEQFIEKGIKRLLYMKDIHPLWMTWKLHWEVAQRISYRRTTKWAACSITEALKRQRIPHIDSWGIHRYNPRKTI